MKKYLEKLFLVTPDFFRLYRSFCILMLMFFLLAGSVFAFLAPAFRSPDEPAHWNAAVSRFAGAKGESCSLDFSLYKHLATGKLVSNLESQIALGRYRDIGSLPASCIKSAIWYGNGLTYYGYVLAKTFIKDFVPMRYLLSAADWSVVSYFFSRVLQGWLVLGLLWRMVYLTSKSASAISVSGTILMLGLSISPLFLQQSFSVTSDTIVLAAALSLVNLLFHRRVVLGDSVLALFLCLNAMVAKPVYAPAFLMWAVAVFVLDYKNLRIALAGCEGKRRLQRLLQNRGFLFFLSMSLVCAYAMFHFLTVDKGYADHPKKEVNTPEQLRFLLSDIPQGISIVASGLYNFISLDQPWHLLGWFDFPMSNFTVFVWQRIFSLCLFFEIVFLCLTSLNVFATGGERRKLLKSMFFKLVIVVLICVGVYGAAFASSLSMYLFWSPVGSRQVEGLQLRYFLPLVILMIGLLKAVGSEGMLPTAAIVRKKSVAVSLNMVGILILTALGSIVTVYLIAIVLSTLKRYY